MHLLKQQESVDIWFMRLVSEPVQSSYESKKQDNKTKKFKWSLEPTVSNNQLMVHQHVVLYSIMKL